jgi:hypothetical protein
MLVSRVGAGGIFLLLSYLFLLYSSILSSWRGVHRQLLKIYFRSQVNDLRGKSSKRALDKNCRDREAGLEALLVGSPGLADANVIDAIE